MNRRHLFGALVGLVMAPIIAIQRHARNDVRRYGAVPDGKTDCTAAIQRCIELNSSARFPPGDYRVSETLKC